ncbi:MAG: ABC transporter substrate-binding protein [Ruthenibacterium sp.]
MKKLMSVLLVCALAGGMLTACGDKPAQSAAGSGTPASTAEKKDLSGSITLMASQNWIKDIDRELFQAFEEETGVEVKVLLTPDNGYATLLGTSLAGGSNAVDMFMYHAGSAMVTAGIPDVALELSGEPWVGNLEDWAKQANTYQDKLVGFPTWGVDYEGILYNKTLFEEKGWEIPNTWDEFIALCDQIKADGMMPMYEGINGVWHTESWVYALTPAILAEKPDYVEYLNSDAANKWGDIKALSEGMTQLRDFLGAKEGGKAKYYTNDGQAEDWFGSYPAMQNREVAMMMTYTAYPAELKANGSTDEWGMFACPLLDNQVVVANGGGVSKYINKNSQNLDACKALFEFLARDENLEKYYAARTDLVSASFKEVESVSPTAATTEALERSKVTPPVRMNGEVMYWDTNMYSYLQGFAAGTLSVEDAINKLDEFRSTMFETAAE